MKFLIGGGVHEHGRNCFFVQADKTYIVDCGVMRGDEHPYPRLTEEEIRAAEFLFLTHMHEDHIGAFSWLLECGFRGTVVAAQETLAALPPYEKTFALPDDKMTADLGGLSVDYGRSGHCVGALWYHIRTAESSALFSGDYSEHSRFCVDKIEGRTAELAVLDCAFGHAKYDAKVQGERIRSFAEEAVTRGPLLLPVPKNGRAADLVMLLSGLDCPISLDKKLTAFFEGQRGNGRWLPVNVTDAVLTRVRRGGTGHEIAFLADAQLATEQGRAAAREALERGGSVLLTGHTDEGSEAERLLLEGRARAIPFNAHSCMEDDEALLARNNFARVVFNHSKDV